MGVSVGVSKDGQRILEAGVWALEMAVTRFLGQAVTLRPRS